MVGIWGKSLSFIARQRPDQTIYGFDNFMGLPEEWVLSAARVYTQKTYSREGNAPEGSLENTELLIGLFAETINNFCAAHTGNCAFIHIDCDLYSSTMDALNGLFHAGKIIPGTVILFDEFYNYPNYKDYEYRAWEHFIQSAGLRYRWLAHTESPVDWNGNQAALIII